MRAVIPADLFGMTRLTRRLKAQSTKSKALILLGLFVVIGGIGYAATSLTGSANEASDAVQASSGTSAPNSSQTQAGSQSGSTENGANGNADSAPANSSQGTADSGPSGELVVRPAPSEPQILASRRETSVQSVTVEPGEFLVVSSGQIENSVPPYKTKRRTDCTLYNGSKELASASAFNRGFVSDENAVSDGSQESITMRTTVKVENPSMIALKCAPQDGRTKALMTLSVERVG